MNLNEGFQLFKERYPDKKIGFNKFSKLRPKQAVLAGASGTHTVCVCLIHQNNRFMYQAMKFENLKEKLNVNDVSDFLVHIQCNPPNISCWLGECNECGQVKVIELKSKIENILDEECIEEIKYQKWVTVDRSHLETVIKPVAEFVEEFCSSLTKFQRHQFLTDRQQAYYQETKRTLKKGELLVQCDFSENYSYKVQDEPQPWHWNNDMVTLHTTVGYHINDKGDLEHINYVAISENNTHDAVAVQLYLRKFLDFAKTKITGLSKVIYWSDGCAAQYKNRKVKSRLN